MGFVDIISNNIKDLFNLEKEETNVENVESTKKIKVSQKVIPEPKNSHYSRGLKNAEAFSNRGLYDQAIKSYERLNKHIVDTKTKNQIFDKISKLRKNLKPNYSENSISSKKENESKNISKKFQAKTKSSKIPETSKLTKTAKEQKPKKEVKPPFSQSSKQKSLSVESSPQKNAKKKKLLLLKNSPLPLELRSKEKSQEPIEQSRIDVQKTSQSPVSLGKSKKLKGSPPKLLVINARPKLTLLDFPEAEEENLNLRRNKEIKIISTKDLEKQNVSQSLKNKDIWEDYHSPTSDLDNSQESTVVHFSQYENVLKKSSIAENSKPVILQQSETSSPTSSSSLADIPPPSSSVSLPVDSSQQSESSPSLKGSVPIISESLKKTDSTLENSSSSPFVISESSPSLKSSVPIISESLKKTDSTLENSSSSPFVISESSPSFKGSVPIISESLKKTDSTLENSSSSPFMIRESKEKKLFSVGMPKAKEAKKTSIGNLVGNSQDDASIKRKEYKQGKKEKKIEILRGIIGSKTQELQEEEDENDLLKSKNKKSSPILNENNENKEDKTFDTPLGDSQKGGGASVEEIKASIEVKTSKKEEEPFFVLSYDFTKIPDISELSRSNYEMGYAYQRYRSMLIKAQDLVRHKMLRNALNYYEVVANQNIPEELRKMVNQNMNEITTYLSRNLLK